MIFGDEVLDAVLQEDDDNDALLLFMQLAPQREQKQKSWEYPGGGFDNYTHGLLYRGESKTRYRMRYRTFIKLVEMLRPWLTIDEGQSRRSTGGDPPLSPGVVVAIGVLFLTGSPTADIAGIFGVCLRSVGNSVDKFLAAVDECPELEISFPPNEDLQGYADQWHRLSQAHGIYYGNIGALDGWLCTTDKPGDVNNPADHYSGHYSEYGLDIQAMCDANLESIYFGVVAPGRTNDGRVFHRCERLVSWLNQLPPDYSIVADNAYTLDNNLLVPPSGPARQEPYKRTYNFYLSQLRIRIEMAFGRLTTKWRIFRRRLSYSTPKDSLICMVAAKLHNYIIDGDNIRFRNSYYTKDFDVGAIDGGPRSNRGYLPTLPLKPKRGRDTNITCGDKREEILSELRSRDMRRPPHNIDRDWMEELNAAPIYGKE